MAGFIILIAIIGGFLRLKFLKEVNYSFKPKDHYKKYILLIFFPFTIYLGIGSFLLLLLSMIEYLTESLTKLLSIEDWLDNFKAIKWHILHPAATIFFPITINLFAPIAVIIFLWAILCSLFSILADFFIKITNIIVFIWNEIVDYFK